VGSLAVLNRAIDRDAARNPVFYLAVTLVQFIQRRAIAFTHRRSLAFDAYRRCRAL
jgi:hypothetical protein